MTPDNAKTMKLPDWVVQMNKGEEDLVEKLGDRIGYGRLMQLAEQIWRGKSIQNGTKGSEHTTGPCAVFMVPCSHSVKDKNGHCEICCGAGRVTKYVEQHFSGTPINGELLAALKFYADRDRYPDSENYTRDRRESKAMVVSDEGEIARAAIARAEREG